MYGGTTCSVDSWCMAYPLTVHSSDHPRDISQSSFLSKATPSRSEFTKIFSSVEEVWFFSKAVRGHERGKNRFKWPNYKIRALICGKFLFLHFMLQQHLTMFCTRFCFSIKDYCRGVPIFVPFLCFYASPLGHVLFGLQVLWSISWVFLN